MPSFCSPAYFEIEPQRSFTGSEYLVTLLVLALM